MTRGIFAHIEIADDPGFVWLRTSASPNPERKPAMQIALADLDATLKALLRAADSGTRCENLG